MKSPGEMFEHELAAVFVRWWEESDLDELDMAHIAMKVIENFAESSVAFEADFHIDDVDEEDFEVEE